MSTDHVASPAAERTASQALEDRYGTRKNRRKDRWVGWIVAALAVAGGILFLATGGLPSGSTAIEVRDLAHEIVDDRNVSLTYELTAPAEARIGCAIEALNSSYAVVGWKVLELPVAEERTRVFTEELVTTNRATTVTAKQCWVIPEA